MILLVDNYDSFSYNLFQLAGSISPDIRVIRNDEMTVEVELGELFSDTVTDLKSLIKEVTHQLKDEILITPKVKLVPKGSLPSAEGGKAVRVKDLRKLF